MALGLFTAFFAALNPFSTTLILLIIGGSRSFSAGLGNPINNIANNTPQLAKIRKGMFLGLFNANLGSRRLIHGTATMSSKDYYDTLGVNKNATASEIKKAYFGLARKLHPDVNKDDPEAEKKIQEVSKPYEVLKDENKRAEYNQV